MGMSAEEAKNIVGQLQQAHRLAVGFYQRILPTLDVIAGELGCVFSSWSPIYTDRPCRSASQPSKYWAWDYLPLFASEYIYWNVRGKKQTGPEDFSLKFELYIEDSIEESVEEGQPNPIEMPTGAGVLKAYLWRPKTNVSRSFEELWVEEGDEDTPKGRWGDISEHWEGIAFEWPLADVIRDIHPIIAELQKHGCRES